MTMPQPLWIAHRGASREQRENTIPAFSRALELGVDGIELDVHSTRDGHVVVHHDPDVRSGDRLLPISDSTLSSLREVDVGSGERIPTLDEVLELVGRKAELLVELKGSGIEAAVASCIRRHPATCAVHSFDHRAVERVAARWPELRRGLLFDHPPRDLVGSMRRAAAADVWARLDVTTPALVDEGHALGARIIVWTVNDPAQAATLVAYGADAICTDDVAAVRPIP